jgi:hypothetical protein
MSLVGKRVTGNGSAGGCGGSGRGTTELTKTSRRALVVVLLLASACGRDVPVRPTVMPPEENYPLKPGPHWIEIGGYGYSDSPDLPACTPLGSPHDGTYVIIRVALSRDGPDWVARSPSDVLGNIELRFRESGRSLFGTTLAGTIRGSATQADYPFPYLPGNVRVWLGGSDGTRPGQVEGTLTRTVSYATGRITGSIRFSNRLGLDSSTCSVVEWSLQPTMGNFFNPT